MSDRAARQSFPIVDLHGAFIRRTELSGANLRGANLRKADCSGASFVGADFAGARLTGTILRRADLTGARKLPIKQLSEAIIDDQTHLPAYIDRGRLNGALLSSRDGTKAHT